MIEIYYRPLRSSVVRTLHPPVQHPSSCTEAACRHRLLRAHPPGVLGRAVQSPWRCTVRPQQPSCHNKADWCPFPLSQLAPATSGVLGCVARSLVFTLRGSAPNEATELQPALESDRSDSVSSYQYIIGQAYDHYYTCETTRLNARAFIVTDSLPIQLPFKRLLLQCSS